MKFYKNHYTSVKAYCCSTTQYIDLVRTKSKAHINKLILLFKTKNKLEIHKSVNLGAVHSCDFWGKG